MDSDEIRLARDGIREAILEIRFNSRLNPEIVVGRLADAPIWRDRIQNRLPTAEMPMQLRAIDPGLTFAPNYELATTDGRDLVRIGPSSISAHRLEPYSGWEKFHVALDEAVSTLFETVNDPAIMRLGLRYTNALTQAEHLVGGVSDLNVVIATGSSAVADDVLLVFKNRLGDQHDAQVTIATPNFVRSPMPVAFDILIDVDVSSPDGMWFMDSATVRTWIEEAHRLLKKQFFSLFHAEVIDKLKA